jgi:Bromodomain associated
MSSVNLHNSLLRPAVLQILRAAGFNYTRNAILDTITDLAARYLLLLASATAQHAFNNHNDYVPTVQDVRLALLEVGAFRPQLSVLEERAKGVEEINGETVPFEDMRGVDGFVNWARGPANQEIRRIAGLVGEAGAGEGLAVLDEEEDYVTGESDPVESLAYMAHICSLEEETLQDRRRISLSRLDTRERRRWTECGSCRWTIWQYCRVGCASQISCCRYSAADASVFRY